MRGKTPVLSGDEMRQLLDSIDTSRTDRTKDEISLDEVERIKF
jgi:hypothetical protein